MKQIPVAAIRVVDQSGGKVLSHRTRQGNHNLKRVLIKVAQAAARVKELGGNYSGFREFFLRS
ncbi:transposase [Armatimonas sp.]|uniref:transposase n=1 Tax=Armatimonas sp. TaxID=1872638 RepID=UPI0037525DAE